MAAMQGFLGPLSLDFGIHLWGVHLHLRGLRLLLLLLLLLFYIYSCSKHGDIKVSCLVTKTGNHNIPMLSTRHIHLLSLGDMQNYRFSEFSPTAC